jgi:hypothetical protein
MFKQAILTVTLLLLLGASAADAGWYFTINPPNGGLPFLVGPYNNYSDAADTLGSALFASPWACHLQWSKYNCRIIGNGFAYPGDFPYPVPGDEVIPSPNLTRASKGSYSLAKGWYFLFYTAIGGSIEKCSELKAFKVLARNVPGDEIPRYSDMQCPGAPCFSVGFDTACE